MLDRYGIDKTAWLGTSMGGLIGMRMASGPLAARLSALVINDIGPEIPQEAIDRILSYAGTSPEFRTVTEAEVWFRSAYLPFGPAADRFWRRMARSSVRRRDNGMFTLHYDPRITIQFTASAEELTTWDRWERISLPVHVIRGAQSDLLTAEIAERMRQSGPRPQVTEMADCGHAPSLSRPEDIAMVRQVLSDLGA
ncbi:alpha/beta fold hydrolase [Oceanicola sp. S124]|uniref:alpha/beta fold hydrolase n=1 Tax=Oceanicola sp. S124 TaxID=1042378 RepID=UPI0003001539|nr:alpha/beta hydrolase [Oceanicola sp. S124]